MHAYLLEGGDVVRVSVAETRDDHGGVDFGTGGGDRLRHSRPQPPAAHGGELTGHLRCVQKEEEEENK